MDPQQTQPSLPNRKAAEIRRAELERKKRDLYKVFNPTNQDHQVVLNKAISPEVWTIEAKNEAIVPYYVAEKYFNEMADKIIYYKSDMAVIAENEAWMNKMGRKMDLHTEQPRFENRNLKNLMGKKEQIVAILNRGLYKEYGVEGQGADIDKRARREEFDPGDVLNQPQNAQSVPQPPQEAKTTESTTEATTAPQNEAEPTEEKPPLYVAKKDRKNDIE